MMKSAKAQAVNVTSVTPSAKTNNMAAIALGLCLVMCVMPEYAMAAGGNPIQSFLDGLIGFLNNGVMRSVGILAVISCGVAAYLGKISWELAMKVGAGIILTFGAAGLVDQFSGYVN